MPMPCCQDRTFAVAPWYWVATAIMPQPAVAGETLGCCGCELALCKKADLGVCFGMEPHYQRVHSAASPYAAWISGLRGSQRGAAYRAGAAHPGIFPDDIVTAVPSASPSTMARPTNPAFFDPG